jgi:hypothetical protein
MTGFVDKLNAGKSTVVTGVNAPALGSVEALAGRKVFMRSCPQHSLVLGGLSPRAGPEEDVQLPAA